MDRRGLAITLGLAAIGLGGYYLHRASRVRRHFNAEASDRLIESYEAYTEGSLGPRSNGWHGKPRRAFRTEPVTG